MGGPLTIGACTSGRKLSENDQCVSEMLSTKSQDQSHAPTEISNLTYSVDQRLVTILGNNGCHVRA